MHAWVEPGDLLLVITGATIGRAALLTDAHEAGIVSQHVGLIRFDQSRLDPRFAFLSLIASGWAGSRVRREKYGQGKPVQTYRNLRELPIPVATMDEQIDAVSRVDALRQNLARHEDLAKPAGRGKRTAVAPHD